jgi:hypothetical protein
MAWKIEGQYFENCSCDVPCPCTVSLDLGADRERCNAFLVFHVDSGEVDGVDVSGLTVAAMIDPPFLAWDEAGRYVTAGVIVGAGIYQLTPLKHACLVKCRSPMMFLAERWRNGRVGGLELGARHGVWCLGCCWALMAALFAVGVMSLGWMALIAAFIAAEKLLPWPVAARRTVAVLLVLLGLGVAIVPADVPGFAEPGMSMPDGGGSSGDGMQMMR